MLIMEKDNDSIQSLGGKTRAERLSADERAAIASKGALMRWGAKATHHGNFKNAFGIDVDCYVLDDRMKTAVISQRGMGSALGLKGSSGEAFPRFMANKLMVEAAGPEIRDKIAQPIKFEWATPGPGKPPGDIYGYDVTLLIEVCQAIVKAEDRLGSRYDDRIKQAHVILAASAKSGIKGLVYALAGYSPATQEVIDAFKLYVQEEARKYSKEFPPELYREWHRLYQIPPMQGRGRSWHMKHLTVRHIYYPLAKSNGKIFELVRALKASGGDQKKKLFQFLNEVGTRALRMHLGRVAEMAEDSTTRAIYEARINKRFGDQQEFDFNLPANPPAVPTLREPDETALLALEIPEPSS